MVFRQEQKPVICLDDIVNVMDIKSFEVRLPLDNEQISWLKESYGAISIWVGRKIFVREIDSLLDNIGDRANFENVEDLDDFRYLGWKILSFRVVNLSEMDKKLLEEYKTRRRLNKFYFRPDVGADHRVYLAACPANHFHIGISKPYNEKGLNYSHVDIFRMFYLKI